jgi:hypothetical protein
MATEIWCGTNAEFQEIGRRAIVIRDFNNKRIAYKNSVAAILKHAVTEIKQDHLADGTVDTK